MVGVAPLMRPLTPSSVGPSVRQIEHQLYEAGVHLENNCSGISATFDMIQAKSEAEIDTHTPPPQSSTLSYTSSSSSSGRPGTKSGRYTLLIQLLQVNSSDFVFIYTYVHCW